jgi:hypothetical protein
MRRIRHSELGNASVLVAGILGVVVALSSAALVIAGYAVGYRRARAAADLSALSAAAAFQHGRDPQCWRITGSLACRGRLPLRLTQVRCRGPATRWTRVEAMRR